MLKIKKFLEKKKGKQNIFMKHNLSVRVLEILINQIG